MKERGQLQHLPSERQLNAFLARAPFRIKTRERIHKRDASYADRHAVFTAVRSYPPTKDIAGKADALLPNPDELTVGCWDTEKGEYWPPEAPPWKWDPDLQGWLKPVWDEGKGGWIFKRIPIDEK